MISTLQALERYPQIAFRGNHRRKMTKCLPHEWWRDRKPRREVAHQRRNIFRVQVWRKQFHMDAWCGTVLGWQWLTNDANKHRNCRLPVAHHKDGAATPSLIRKSSADNHCCGAIVGESLTHLKEAVLISGGVVHQLCVLRDGDILEVVGKLIINPGPVEENQVRWMWCWMSHRRDHTSALQCRKEKQRSQPDRQRRCRPSPPPVSTPATCLSRVCQQYTLCWRSVKCTLCL